jgi:hypothetical protein
MKTSKADIFFDGKKDPYLNIIVAGVGIRLPISKKDKAVLMKGLNKNKPPKIEEIVEVLE